MTNTFICSFTSGLHELKRRKQRDDDAALEVLRRTRRFSVFEATATYDISKTLDRLIESGRITTDNSCEYPWILVTHIDGIELN